MVRQKVQCDNLFMIGPETHDIENRKIMEETDNQRLKSMRRGEEGRGGGGFIFNYGLLNGNQP